MEKEKDKSVRSWLIYGLFSFLFWTINISTFLMQKKPHLSGGEVAIVLLISLLLTPILTGGILWIKKFYISKYVDTADHSVVPARRIFADDRSDGTYFYLVAFIIFIAWLPVFLAFYPGFWAYDVIAQITQVRFSQYSTHHPLLHTLGLGFFYEVLGGYFFEDYTVGVAIASLFQMMVFSLQLSFGHLFLKRLQVKALVRWLLIGFCALCPFMPMLAISMTKDVLFAGFLLMLLTCISYYEVDYAFAKEKKGLKAVFIFSIVATILFRSNGRYGVLVMALVVLVKAIKDRRKSLIFIVLGGVILGELAGFSLKKAFNATSPDPNEMLSIPLQQMAFVYEANYNVLADEDKAAIETLIPQVIDYNRIISDPIKFSAQYVENKTLFWKTYFRMFKSHPRQYLEAFLQNNLGFICVADKTNATVYGTGYERRRGFIMTYTRDGYEVYPQSYFPFLEDLYLKLYCQNDYQKNILTFIPCSMGLYFWLIALSAFVMWDNKSKCLASMFLILALGGTTLLGPCAIIRYALPYIVCLPILWADVLNS